MELSGSQEWQQLLAEPDHNQRRILGNALQNRLTVADIEFLVSAYGSVSSDENTKYTAAGFLLSMLNANDSRVQNGTRSAIAAVSYEITKKEFPLSQLGGRAFAILVKTDASHAENLCMSLDATGLDRIGAIHYIGGLRALKTSESVEKLLQLSKGSDEVAKRAKTEIEVLGLLSETEIAALAEEFRTTRSTKSLNKIFNVYVRFLIGKPLAPPRKLLVEPIREEHEGVHCLVYEKSPPFAQMKIWFDGQGTITDVYSR